MKRTEFQDISSISSKWEILRTLWNIYNPNSTIKFTLDDSGWRISESFTGTPHFELRRDVISLRRYTDTDIYGVLGLSLINPQKSTVILTEGVSDYISTKLLYPDTNVLGITQLGGSDIAKLLLISLFDKFIVCMDNDEAGLKNGLNWKKFLLSYNKKVKLWKTQASRCKDVTDEFLLNLKIDSTNVELDILL